MDVWLQQKKKLCVTVVLYLLMVVVLPTIVYPNLPLDTIEAIAWGRWLSWVMTSILIFRRGWLLLQLLSVNQWLGSLRLIFLVL